MSWDPDVSACELSTLFEIFLVVFGFGPLSGQGGPIPNDYQLREENLTKNKTSQKILIKDPSVKERILELLSAGNFWHVAASAAGLSRTTVYNWIRQGRRDLRNGLDTPEAQFAQEVEKADALGQIYHVNQILRASETSWQASAWFLERKYPKLWGRNRTESKKDKEIVKPIKVIDFDALEVNCEKK